MMEDMIFRNPASLLRSWGFNTKFEKSLLILAKQKYIMNVDLCSFPKMLTLPYILQPSSAEVLSIWLQIILSSPKRQLRRRAWLGSYLLYWRTWKPSCVWVCSVGHWGREGWMQEWVPPPCILAMLCQRPEFSYHLGEFTDLLFLASFLFSILSMTYPPWFP